MRRAAAGPCQTESVRVMAGSDMDDWVEHGSNGRADRSLVPSRAKALCPCVREVAFVLRKLAHARGRMQRRSFRLAGCRHRGGGENRALLPRRMRDQARGHR